MISAYHGSMMNQVVKSQGIYRCPFDHTSPYTEYNDLMKQAKKFEVVEDDDYKVTIDYEKLTTTFELK